MSRATLPARRPVARVVPVALFALLAFACASTAVQPERRRLERGAVVSEQPLATEVGLAILERGGNAADAAVATALALAVVYPQAGNLGGGGFAIWAPAKGETLALDFRETAPSGLAPALFLDAEGNAVPERSTSGALAIGIPGSPRGLFELFERCGSGSLDFRDLVEPAIRLARDGFVVDAWLARDLADPDVRAKMNPAALRVFYPAGRALEAGELLVQPELAATLSAYASHGPALFYRERLAEAIRREILRTPVPGVGLPPESLVSLDDLRTYQTRWTEPLRGWFRGNEILSMPPPSSGGVALLQMLGILEGLPLDSARREAPGVDPVGEELAHWWIEAMRLAFADRAEHLGDPRFYDVPLSALLSPAWIAARRVSIGERANLEVEPWAPAPAPESSQTTHLSVVDRAGNALALTTTLNASFGSGVMVEGAGFLLNDEMDDFAVQPGVPNQFGLVGSEANSVRPGKRPLSSMCPVVVLGPEGELRLVLGSPGGPRIITAVMQVLLRALVLDEPLDEAVRAPRLHQQWRPETTDLENTPAFHWDQSVIDGLLARGQPIELRERTFGSVQAIEVRPDGEPVAVSDPRRGGSAGLEDR